MSKGIYIHYPFCTSKCFYCDFYSLACLEKRREYEKALVEAILGIGKKEISTDTVYFGGGTPSLMTRVGAKEIFSALVEAFSIEENASITLEANPEGLEKEDFEFFKTLGVNRISFGAQSFSDSELEKLGRRHTSLDIEKSVLLAKEVGFEDICLDLMYNIPCETLESFQKSVDMAIRLPITHISLYGLLVEEKTKFGRMVQRGEDILIQGEDVEREMYFGACEKLEENGFLQYEISNFAKAQFQSRHNLKYWKGEEYFGIGASAHSYVDGVRFSSPRSITQFCENPILRENEETIGFFDRALEYIMLSLRLCEGINLKKLEKEFSLTPTPEYRKLEENLIKNNLLLKNGENVSLTREGFFVSNAVIAKICESFNL